MFELQNDGSWNQAGTLTATSPEAGASVALSETHAALVGGGAVSMFERQSDGSWTHQQDLAEPTGTDAGLVVTYSEFGDSVAIDAGRLAVSRIVGIAGPDGVTTESERTEVMLFEPDPSGDWIYQTTVTVANAGPEVGTGSSIALQGDTLVVGSERQVDLFVHDGAGTWNGVATLSPSLPNPTGFGSALSLSGDWLALSSVSGVSVIHRDGVGDWGPHQDLTTNDPLTAGAAVAISNLFVLAGGAEGAWQWQIDALSQFVEVGKLAPFDGLGSVGFGAAVAVGPGHFLVAAPGDYELGTDSGSVYALPHGGSTGPEVTFPDPQLEAGIRAALSIPSGPITQGAMDLLTNLDLSGLGITDLNGLEAATTLRILNIRSNTFTEVAATWAILDGLALYCLYSDLPRPGGDSPGLLTEPVTDTSGNTFYIVVDASNLPTLDITGLDIDTGESSNLDALQAFRDAGVEIETGAANVSPTAVATAAVLDHSTGQVALDGGGSDDLDGAVVAWAWSWGEGSDSGANPTVTLPIGETVVSLTVTDNDGATSATSVTVAVGPEIVVEHPSGNPLASGADTIGFGTVAIGATVERVVTIRNTGEAPLAGLQVEVPSGFSIDSAGMDLSVAPAGITSVKVLFTPPAAGSYSGTLRILSNDADDSPFEISLSGEAEAAAVIFDSALAATGLDGANALPDAMPFADGVSNLLKYAFNMDLSGPDVNSMEPGGNSGLPGGQLVENDGEIFWRVQYVRRKGSGLVYTPKKSTSLEPGSFVALEATPALASIDAEWERDTIDEPCNPLATPTCFSFVEVALP